MNTKHSQWHLHSMAVLIYPIIGLLSIVSIGRATQVVHIVSPAGFEDVEGNTVMAPYQTPYPDILPVDVLGYRTHLLIQSSLFEPFGPGPFEITALRARPDISVDEPLSTVWQETWNLTTTRRNSLTTTYADNFGTEPIEQVYSGNVTYETDGVPRGGGLPHEFVYGVGEFDVPYIYDPQKGNLLAEFTSTTHFDATNWVWYDYQRTGVTGQELQGAGGATTGYSYPGQTILQLTVRVPEPSTVMLSMLGLLGILATAYRRPSRL